MSATIDRDSLLALIAELAFVDQSEIQGDSPLFSSGLIDSVSLLEIVVYLEKTYSVKVHGGEISLENFNSLDSMVRFISNKCA